MSEDRIRVGIIGANLGYGWGTRAHLPALTALPEFEVTAVCTTRRETAQATAERYRIPLAFDNAEEMANDPRVDLVIVCVRVPSHHQLVMTALNAGKHVFCEWPLGANLHEAVEMRDLAVAKGVRHMVGLQARGAPALGYLKDLAADGYLGDAVSVTMHASSSGAGQRTAGNVWQTDRAKGANTLTIQGGHSIDALRFALGDFREVSGIVATRFPRATVADTGETVDVSSPDNVLVDGTLRGGAVASIHVESVPAHGSGFALTVYGTEGALCLTGAAGAQIGDLTLTGGRTSDKDLTPMAVPEKYRWVPDGVPIGPPFNVAQLLASLARGIRDGTPAGPNFGTAVELHQLLDAIERASETGQRQALG